MEVDIEIPKVVKGKFDDWSTVWFIANWKVNWDTNVL